MSGQSLKELLHLIPGNESGSHLRFIHAVEGSLYQQGEQEHEEGRVHVTTGMMGTAESETVAGAATPAYEQERVGCRVRYILF